MASEGIDELQQRNRDLQERLDEAEETLRALRSGEVDAVVASGPDGNRVYTLIGADAAYRVMVENMADGAFTVALDGLILFSNEQFARLLGAPLGRVIGSSIHDFIAAEDAALFAALFTSSVEMKAEVRLKKGPAATTPAQLAARTLQIDDTECICFVATDLTEQKRNQEMVAAERLARSILDQAAGAILVLDPHGTTIRASRAAEQLTGATVLLRRLDDVLRLHSPSEGRDLPLAEILSLVEKQGSIAGLESTVRRPDGQVLDVMLGASLLTGANGERLGSIVLVSDVSALKRAEQALRKSDERFRALVTASSDVVYRMSPDWGEMQHLRGRDFIADTETPSFDWLQKYIPPDDQARVMAVIKEAIRTRSIFELEHRVLRTDGSLGWTHSRAVPLQDENGEIVEWFGAASDVTERKRSEERLREAQKLESIGLLAAGVAHDFNNILTVIMGSASVALEDSSSSEYARAILTAAERAADLTRQLLAYAGKGRIDRKLIDLTELVSKSKELLRASIPKRVSLDYDLSQGLTSLEADPSQIEQILMNLVINASEAISPKTDGLIRIATRSCEVTAATARHEVSTGYVEPGPYVCLEVRDNGPGIDEATLGHIFEPFFTTKFSGRGLGLAAVQGIVRSSQGFIKVRSQPGDGAAFEVFLPARQKAALEEQKEPVAAAPGPPQRRSATILVVDDEESVRKLARVALQRRGYAVLEAVNGVHALAVLDAAPARPDLVLLDQAMPVMGGDELIPILAEKYPGLKILMSSGYPEEEARRTSPAAAITNFLRKPYTIHMLAEKIAAVLD